MAKTNFNRLLSEAASIQNDIQNPAISGIYLNPDRVAQGSFVGPSIYDDVERDAHAYAVIQKLKLGVIAYPWTVKPGDDSPQAADAAEFARKVLDRIGFDLVTFDLLDSVLKGFAVVELMWDYKGGELSISRCIPRASYRFLFDADLQLRLKTRENVWPGNLTPPRKFLVHTYGGKDANPYGVGLGSKLLALVRIKRELVKRAAEFAERVANGTVVATVAGGRDAELDAALEIAETVVSSGVVAISDSTKIELLEPKGNADQLFENLIRLLNGEISKCVLGETATTEVTNRGDMNALGKTHNTVRIELIRAHADALSVTFNRLLAWLTELNFGPEVVPPTVYRQVGEEEDFINKVKRDHLVAALGYRPSLAYVQETYGGHWELAPENVKVPPVVAGIIG